MPRQLFPLFFLICCACEETPSTLFTSLSTSQTNVRFQNLLEESADFNVLKYGYFYNGGGLGVGDLNNDGVEDLYFSGNLVANQLYYGEEGGNLRYRRAPEAAGIGGADGWNTGVSLVDINGDGRLDIYQCRSAAASPRLRRNLLFVNNGDETFTERAAEYGLADPAYSTQAVFFDYDRDGDLDCFVLNHSVQQYAGFAAANRRNKATYDRNFASKLFRNDGGAFTDITEAAGLTANVLGFGLAVAVSDFDGDGWADLYVSNDYHEEDYFYRNQADGTFRSELRAAFDHVSLFSMGSDVADLNGDGRPDLVTLDMLPAGNERIKMTSGDDNYQKFRALVDQGFFYQYSRNMLHLNRGDRFVEVGQQWGISNTDWSWSVLAGDLDLDAKPDLFVTNGYARDYTNMEFLNYTMSVQTQSRQSGKAVDQLEVIANMPAINVPNYAFANRGNGFADVSEEWGFTESSISHGAALADLDADGDLDVVVSNVNAPASLLRNGAEGHSLRVDLRQAPPARAIGAKVTVETETGRQVQSFYPSRGFQSSAYVPLVFGLGAAAGAESVRVDWTDGRTTVLTDLAGKTTVAPAYQAGQASPAPAASPSALPWTVDTFPFVYRENPQNDFDQQRLLPWMLSYSGPALAIDATGKFLYHGGARAQSGRIFRVDGNGFTPIFAVDSSYEDAAAGFADLDGDGDDDLVVVSTGYELDAANHRLRPRIYRNDNGQFVQQPADLPLVSAGAIAFPDVNLDGFPDLFLGSRVAPGDYPQGGDSYLLLNDGTGNFGAAMAYDLGMVTAATVPEDGAELFVARAFGTVARLTFTENGLGTPQDLSPSGRWTALKLNPDGKHLIAGNLGLNHQLAAVSEAGLTLYHGNFLDNGQRIPLLAYEQDGKSYPFAARDELFAVLPGLKKNYPDYVSYSTATVEEIFGKELVEADQLKAAELRSMVIPLNGGEPVPLPPAAQYAPVYASATPDVNGDGIPDLVLGGNLSQTRVRIGQIAANHGQVFLGDGDGGYVYRGDLGIRGNVRGLVNLPGNRLLWGRNRGAAIVTDYGTKEAN